MSVETASIVAAAERVLSGTFGRKVELGDVARLSDDDRRNLLLRCRDLSGKSPASVIIKKVVAGAYDPADTSSWDTQRFTSDRAGAEFLSEVLPASLTPRFYGGEHAAGFFILEDLGEDRSLVEPLLEGDAGSAERALLAFCLRDWRRSPPRVRSLTSSRRCERCQPGCSSACARHGGMSRRFRSIRPSTARHPESR